MCGHPKDSHPRQMHLGTGQGRRSETGEANRQSHANTAQTSDAIPSLRIGF